MQPYHFNNEEVNALSAAAEIMLDNWQDEGDQHQVELHERLLVTLSNITLVLTPTQLKVLDRVIEEAVDDWNSYGEIYTKEEVEQMLALQDKLTPQE